jgi:hypothetical protein
MKLKHFLFPTLALAAGLALNACIGDSPSDDNTPPVDTTGVDTVGRYLIITTNMSGQGYAATFDSVPTGEVDIASSPNAIQVQTGWGSGAQFQGSDFYIIASYTGTSGIHKYTVKPDGKIVDGGVLTGATHFHVASASKGYYYDAALGKMKVQTFNPATMERTGAIDLASLSKGDAQQIAGDQLLVSHAGKLFVNVTYGDSLYSSFILSKYDTGYVAVIDMGTNTLDKVIKAPGVPFGFGYPADMTWSFTDAQDNLYLISPFNKPWTTPGDRGGQIRRISATTLDFDGWKADSTTLGSHRSLMGAHFFNGQIYASFWKEPTDFNTNFVTDAMQGVKIDPSTRLVTPLAGTPTFRFNANTPIHEVDGKLYFAVLNATYNGMYEMSGDSLKARFTAKTGGAVLHLHKLK